MKQKLLVRCGVPPFLCWPFEQHNCLVADHCIKSTPVSLFHPLWFGHFSRFQELALLPAVWSPGSVQGLQCRAEAAVDKPSTTSVLWIASPYLQCPVCSLGVTKVPFVLLLSPATPEKSVSFFPAGIKPQIKPQVLN